MPAVLFKKWKDYHINIEVTKKDNCYYINNEILGNCEVLEKLKYIIKSDEFSIGDYLKLVPFGTLCTIVDYEIIENNIYPKVIFPFTENIATVRDYKNKTKWEVIKSNNIGLYVIFNKDVALDGYNFYKDIPYCIKQNDYGEKYIQDNEKNYFFIDYYKKVLEEISIITSNIYF